MIWEGARRKPGSSWNERDRLMSDLLTKPDLRRRGWRGLEIISVLGNPDGVVPWPGHQPRKGWLRSRVEAAEQSGARRTARGAWYQAEQARWEWQLTKTQQFVDRVRIDLPRLCYEDLVQDACDHHRRRSGQPPDATGNAFPHCDPRDLDRLCVNYLRHEHTDYDRALRRLDRWERTDVKEVAVQQLRERILQEIAANLG
jgi:hypothetical protein